MLRVSFFLIVCLVATSLFAQDANELKQLMDNQRYSTAEKILESKVQDGGEQPELNYLLVSAYLYQDKPSEARTFLEEKKITPTNNTDPYNRIAYASYLINTGQQDQANKIFSELLEDKKAKKDVGILSAIANAYIISEKGDVNEALKVIEMAEKRDKNNAAIKVLKGNAYRKIHDGSNAYVAYQDAIKSDPRNLEAHYQLGKIFLTQKSEGMYMEQFLKAYYIDSSYAPVLKALYDHYYFKDVQTAMSYLEKYIKNSDYSVQNDYSLTDMYYLNKEYDKAIDLASSIMEKEKEKTQPRLYKLIAYSYDEKGEKEKAWDYLQQYFAKEDPKNFVARDFEFKGKLLAGQPGMENESIESYKKAFALDTVDERKMAFAKSIADASAKLKDYSSQAAWLEKVFELKKDRTNVDLFNWGVAHYKAGENVAADSVFAKYTAAYPEDIFGYYWRAQVNAAIDTSLTLGLAIPYYQKLIELGEKDTAAHKAKLLKAYSYLGGYEANITKDFKASLAWFEKFLQLDPENKDANHYAEILKKWISDANKDSTTEGDKASS